MSFYISCVLLLLLVYGCANSAYTLPVRCKEYSPFYGRVEEVRKYWTAQGKVYADTNLNCTNFQVKVYQNKVYFKGYPMETSGQQRAEIAIVMINEAVKFSQGMVPDVEFVINGIDDPVKASGCPAWSSCDRLDSYELANFLIPDTVLYHSYYTGLSDWETIMRHTRIIESSSESKIEKALWRGAPLGIKAREELLEVAKSIPATLADIKAIEFGHKHKDYLPAEEWCRYKFLIYTEGFTWSMRSTHMLLCKSIIITNALNYVTIPLSALLPGDMVIVDKHWQDLPEVLERLQRNHSTEMKQAVDRSRRFNRLLAHNGILCVILRQLIAHASILNYKVPPPSENWTHFDTYVVHALKHAHDSKISQIPFFEG